MSKKNKQWIRFALLVLLILPTAPAAAETLLWEQLWDGQSQYGPSVDLTPGTLDQEIADDFELTASISRIFASGTRGFPPPPQATLTAVEVRFYAVASDGSPGAVEAEYVLADGDPNLSYDVSDLNSFDITLSPPFEASGQHFLGIKAVVDQFWFRMSSNGGNPRGSAIWFRDDAGGGDWEPYVDIFGEQNADIGFALYGELVGAPVIDSLSHASLDRSGRLRISGANLGGDQGTGTVLLDGVPAWIGSWSDSAIDVWVPETVGPGSVNVEVTTAAGTSNALALDVTLRQADGRLRWVFETDGRGVRHRAAVGADGTVYAQDTRGLLYALTPDGGLKWVFTNGGAGADGPVVIGHDGTIYVTENPLGADVNIVAVNPDGTLRWVYTDGGQSLISGPGVGPDGNIYAVTDFGGSGALSLTPEGDLRWTNPGSPPFIEFGQLGTEIAFGADRFFVAFDESAMNPIALLYGMSFDGSQLFAVGRPNGNAQPATGPAGDVYLQTWDSGEGIELGSYDSSGNLDWTAFQGITNTLSHPGVGPDGRIFAVRNLIEVNAVRPDGSIEWTATDASSATQGPIVNPDGSMMVIGFFDFGGPGSIKGWSTDGDSLWTVVIPNENGGGVTPSSRPIFDPAGHSAYVGVEPLINPDDDLHSYVYALDTTAGGDFELSLTQTDLVRGSPASFTVTGAEPGEAVIVLMSRAGPGPGGCPGFLGGLCLDIQRPIRNLGTAIANSSGTAVLTRTIPASLPEGSLHTQAVIARGVGGADSVKSNVVSAPLLP